MLERIKRRFFANPGQIVYIPISSIYPNPAQPRKTFLKDELEELSASIKESGLIQPITVRIGQNNKYQLVAGERRLRACALAGLKDIPCVIYEMDDKQSSVIALVENLQRSNLNFFEEAEGIYNLIKLYGLSQEEVAGKLGKSQSAISNKLRLLKLDPEVIHKITNAFLSERHARALLRLNSREEQLKVLERIIRNKMTVAETDKFIDKLLLQRISPSSSTDKPKQTFIFKDLRLFLNTINHAVDTMRSSGIAAQIDKQEDEESICMTICISKNVPRET